MFSRRKKVGIALANGFEFYDVAVYSAISVYIGLNFFPESYFGAHSTLMIWMTFALRYLSRPLGGFIIGVYADKYGRKSALILTSFLTGVATLIMACLPSFYEIGLMAPCLFFLMQLIQAFAFGGENPTSVVYLMENTHKKDYAKTGALVWGGLSLIVALSLLIVYVLKTVFSPEQMQDFGWRIPIYLGVINLVFGFWFRLRLIESSRFSPSSKIKVHMRSTFKIFLMAVPACMLSYINSLFSSQMIRKFISDPFLQDLLPILMNISFFVTAVITGYFVDKYSSCTKLLNRTYAALVILSVPIYALQDQGHWFSLVLSQLCITLLVSVSLATSPFVFFNHIKGHNKATTFGVGYNFTVIIFGGSMPLMVNYLSQYGQAYVGLLLSFGGLCYFAALALDKYTQPASASVSTAS